MHTRNLTEVTLHLKQQQSRLQIIAPLDEKEKKRSRLSYFKRWTECQSPIFTMADGDRLRTVVRVGRDRRVGDSTVEKRPWQTGIRESKKSPQMRGAGGSESDTSRSSQGGRVGGENDDVATLEEMEDNLPVTARLQAVQLATRRKTLALKKEDTECLIHSISDVDCVLFDSICLYEQLHIRKSRSLSSSTISRDSSH